MSVAAALLVIVPLAALQPYRAQEPVPAPAAPAAPVAAAAPMRAATPASVVARPVTPAAPTAPAVAASAWGSSTPAAIAPAAPAAPAAPSRAAGYAPYPAPATPAVPAAAPPAPVRAASRDCANARLGGTGTSTSIHSDDDGEEGGGMIEYYTFDGTRCAQASLVGRIAYTADETDVRDMSDDAHAYFRERTADDDRSVAIHRMNGALVRSYRHNGAAAAWDDDARRWLARFLPGVLADAGINVKPRVARWYGEGGVDRALRGIASLHGGGARTTHYGALLSYRLTPAEVDRVVRQAGRELAGSSGDLSAILSQAAPTLRGTPAAVEVMATIAAIPSSGDRTAVLRLYGETDDREALLALARVAEGIPSSGDRAGLLASLAPRYLAGSDRALRDAWFGATGTIPSSGDKAGVLSTAIGYAARSDDDALALIAGARHIASSGDRAGLLSALASANRMRTPAVREAYLQAVRELPGADTRQALENLARP